MSRRSSRSDVMYTKEELERMKFWELKYIAKKRNLSRRFTTKHEIIDSLLNFELEDNLSMETLTLVNNSYSEQDYSSKETDKTSPMRTRQKNIPQSKNVTRQARRRFSKPRTTFFQLYNSEDEPNVTSVNDELQKGNGKYFEALWASDMINSPEVSLNKSTATSTKKAVTQLLTGYSETLVTASPYPTRNRRSTRNPTPLKSASRSRRTKTKEPSKCDEAKYEDTFSKNPSVYLTDTKDQLEEEKGSEESKTEHNFVIDLRDKKVNKDETSRIKSSRDRRKRSKFFKIECIDPEIVMDEDFVKDGLQNHESEFPQPAVTPFEETQTIQSGRKLRSRVIKADLSPLPIKEAEAVEEESPKLNETFEIKEEINNIHFQQRGNGVTVSKLRKSLRTSTKMLPSKELETSKIQDKSDNKENKSAVDLKINGTYELPKEDLKLNNIYELSIGKDTSLSVLKEDGSSVKRRSRSFPRETTKTIEKNFFSPPKSQKKGTINPLKRTRIPIPKFVKKIPDFQNIHKKEFEKMESLVDNHERKLQRAKKLITPCKVGVMVFKGAQSPDKKSQFQKPATQGSPGFRFNLQDRFIPQMNIKARIAPPPIKPVKYFIQKHNVREVKEMVTKKLPVHNRRESIRQESRTKIRGVRLNRRFELQMAHRKIN